MKVILLKEVKNIGKPGDIKNVNDGFARNFLLPKKLAFIATDQEIALVEKRKSEHDRQQKVKIEKLGKATEKLNGLKLVMKYKATDDGTLYQRVHAKDVAQALVKQGVEVDEHMVVIDQPIKMLGVHPVKVVIAGREQIISLDIHKES